MKSDVEKFKFPANKQKRFRYNLPVPADVVAYGEAYDALCEGKGGRVLAECACTSGTNCLKIGLPGKLILSKRKGLLEVLFS